MADLAEMAFSLTEDSSTLAGDIAEDAFGMATVTVYVYPTPPAPALNPFLRLNGIEISVKDGSAKTTPLPIGESVRAVDGSAVRDWRTMKEVWDGQLVLSTSQVALAVRGLMLGLHDTWSFETSLYSARGQPLTGIRSSAQSKFGAYSASVANGYNITIDYDDFDPAVQPWAIAWWQRDGATWNHYVEGSADVRYLNGVAVGPNVSWGTPIANRLSYLNATGATVYVDDLAVFPFDIPTDWPQQMAAFGVALPDAPRLLADGAMIQNNVAGGVQVMGECDGDSFYQAIFATVLTPNAQPVSFKLSKV